MTADQLHFAASRMSLTAWSLTDQFLLYCGWALLVAGGIFGVVTNVQREAGVVTLRVDDSTGAKIRVGTNAIARVVVDEEKSS